MAERPRQYLWTVRYNFAAGSFYTKKLWSKLYSIEIEFCLKDQKSPFEPPCGDLRGNVRTPSIARWKARGRLSIRHNWTFFRYVLWLRRYKRKSVEEKSDTSKIFGAPLTNCFRCHRRGTQRTLQSKCLVSEVSWVRSVCTPPATHSQQPSSCLPTSRSYNDNRKKSIFAIFCWFSKTRAVLTCVYIYLGLLCHNTLCNRQTDRQTDDISWQM